MPQVYLRHFNFNQRWILNNKYNGNLNDFLIKNLPSIYLII